MTRSGPARSQILNPCKRLSSEFRKYRFKHVTIDEWVALWASLLLKLRFGILPIHSFSDTYSGRFINWRACQK
jgi:hypothetical protein